MNTKHDTLFKLLPKTQIPDQDRDESQPDISRYVKLYNTGLALATALLLAFVLLPRFPFLEKGETASRNILAPYTMYIEYPGPDQTVLSYRVNKGEVIVEEGHRVSEKAARILEEIARREGIGNRGYAYLGLSLLIILIFYLFYRDIKRYRAELITDTRKIFLLSFLLLITIIVSQFSKYILSLVADKLPLDMVTIGFALPVSAGGMMVCLLFDFHLALAFSFVVSILLGILFQGDPFMPIYYFLGSISAALCVTHCKRRTAVLRAGALTGLVNLVSILAIDLYKGELFLRGIYDLSAGFFGSLVVSMIVYV
jgi:membrane-associated HD superfamily phosphohydrolase